MLPARPQLPEVSIEAEKANQIDSAPAIQPTGGRIPFGGRVGLFSSPRQRFKLRPRQPQANSDVDSITTSTTVRPTGGRIATNNLLRRRPQQPQINSDVNASTTSTTVKPSGGRTISNLIRRRLRQRVQAEATTVAKTTTTTTTTTTSTTTTTTTTTTVGNLICYKLISSILNFLVFNFYPLWRRNFCALNLEICTHYEVCFDFEFRIVSKTSPLHSS